MTRGIWGLTWGGCWRDVQYIWVATPWLELDVGWWFHFEQRPWKTNMFRRTSFFQCQSWQCHVHRFLHRFFSDALFQNQWVNFLLCPSVPQGLWDDRLFRFSGTTNPDYDFHDLRFRHFQGIAEGWDGSATSAGEGWKSKIATWRRSCQPPPWMICMGVDPLVNCPRTMENHHF